MTIKSQNDNTSNLNNKEKVTKMGDHVLELTNYEDNNKLYFKIRANNDKLNAPFKQTQ